jgi:DNA-binding CsgD family transcriptional regulator
MLVGRTSEQSRLRRVAAAGGALLLVGEPGIGKTALLDDLRRHAGGRVLSTTGFPAESELPFAGLAGLLAPVADAVTALGGPRGAALAGALALGPPSPGDRLAVAMGTVDVLRSLAPVLVLADDLPWVDAPSQECLLMAARRSGDGVAVVATARPGGLPAGHGLTELHLAGLDDEAARGVLAPLPPRDADRVLALAQGNPLALRELPAALVTDRGSEAVVPVDPGEQVTACFAGRIERLGLSARRGLLLVAASHDGRRTDLVRAYAAADLGVEALDEALSAGLLAVHEDRVDFEHPLVRSAAYHGAAPADRRWAHDVLATAVEGPAATWHQAAASDGPDEAIAVGLDQLAEEAQARRAHHVASAAWERAARLSSDGEATCFRLLVAGAAALAAGEPERASSLATEVLDRTGEPVVRAGAEHLAGVVDMWHLDAGRGERRLRSAADRYADDLPHQAAAMLADAALAATSNGDCRRALTNARRGHSLATDGPGALRAHTGTSLAWALLLRGEAAEAETLFEQVEPLLVEVDPLSPAAQSIGLALNIRSQGADLEGARRDALLLSEGAELAGALSGVAFPLGVACEAALRLGDWGTLAGDYGRAVALAGETRQDPPLAFLHVSRVRYRAAVGDREGCLDDVAHARAIANPRAMHSIETYALSALALLALGYQEVDDALALLVELRRNVQRHGQRHPTLVPWAAELVEVLCRVGRDDDAREVVDEIAPWCHGPAGHALLARCRALASGSDFEAAFADARRAGLAQPAAFEQARTLLALGERRRRALRARDAREPLRQARDGFLRLGAAPWVARAEAELRAAGDAPARDSSIEGLTDQQMRIAAVVARGGRNSEVAAELFLSEKTVEYHLTRIYRVAGVRSRTELARWLKDN